MTEAKKYENAKSKYIRHILALELKVDDWMNEEFKEKETKKKLKRLKTNIDDVVKTWEELENIRLSYLEEVGKSDGEKETWKPGESHTLAEEEHKKEELLDNAEELLGRLEGNPDTGPTNKPVAIAVTSHKNSEETDDPVLQGIQEKLASVKVSRKDMEEFQKQLSDQLVEKWKEDSQCKVFRGILKEKYEEFLQLFKETTEVDDKVIAALKTVGIGEDVKDQIKCFQCESTALKGRYGMYVVKTRKGDVERVDICYSLYSFETDLVGVEERLKPLNGQSKVVDMGHVDVITGEVRYNRRLKVKDINALTTNFIVAKALIGFADAGVIPSVRYREDEENPAIEN